MLRIPKPSAAFLQQFWFAWFGLSSCTCLFNPKSYRTSIKFSRGLSALPCYHVSEPFFCHIDLYRNVNHTSHLARTFVAIRQPCNRQLIAICQSSEKWVRKHNRKQVWPPRMGEMARDYSLSLGKFFAWALIQAFMSDFLVEPIPKYSENLFVVVSSSVWPNFLPETKPISISLWTSS